MKLSSKLKSNPPSNSKISPKLQDSDKIARANKLLKQQLENIDNLPSNPNENPNPLKTGVIAQLCVLSLLEEGISQEIIAESAGVSRETISRIARNRKLKDLLSGRVIQIKKSLPSMLYQVATLAISTITREDLLKLNAFQRMITAATAIDKARLMEGSSTMNVSIRDIVPRIQDQMAKYNETLMQVTDLIQRKDGSFAVEEGNK